MHLLPDPVFVLPTDGIAINTVVGTSSGRIFMGGRDGCLYEVTYQVLCLLSHRFFVGSEIMQGMQQRCVLGPSVEQRNSR